MRETLIGGQGGMAECRTVALESKFPSGRCGSGGSDGGSKGVQGKDNREDRRTMGRLGFWKGATAALILGSWLVVGCHGSFLKERHRADRPCSLGTNEVAELDPKEICAVVSGMGLEKPTSGATNAELSKIGTDANGRLLVSFGETNCEFTARQCMVGYCYVLQDFSSLLRRDINITALDNFEDLVEPTGIFKDVKVSGGHMNLTAGGIHFVPTQADVTITYSTKTCAEFYSEFGGEWPQVCTAQFGLVGQVSMLGLVAAPEALQCNKGLPRF